MFVCKYFFYVCFLLTGFHLMITPGFYPGYLRVKSFPPPICPAFPQKILLSIWYIGNYIGKITQTRRGHCTHCNISQNCVSKCTRLHLSANSFQKISCLRTPLGSLLLSATRGFSPKRQILDRSLHVLG